MKNKTILALAAAAMMLYAPLASAYWTGHSELVERLVERLEQWASDQQGDGCSEDTGCKTPEPRYAPPRRTQDRPIGDHPSQR